MKSYNEFKQELVSESVTDVKTIAKTFMDAIVAVNRFQKELKDKLDVEHNSDFDRVRKIFKQLKDKLMRDPQIRTRRRYF